MALRRKLVLPSRIESETSSDSGAVAQASAPARKEPVKAPVAEAAPPAAAVEVAAVPQVDVFAVAAAEAFGTVPEVAPKPRVLEESFVTPVVAEPVSQPASVSVEPEFVAPAWQEPQASSEFVAPAWEVPVEPVAPEAVAPAWDMPAAASVEVPAVTNFAPQETTPEVVPAGVPEPVPAWQMPVQAESPVMRCRPLPKRWQSLLWRCNRLPPLLRSRP